MLAFRPSRRHLGGYTNWGCVDKEKVEEKVEKEVQVVLIFFCDFNLCCFVICVILIYVVAFFFNFDMVFFFMNNVFLWCSSFIAVKMDDETECCICSDKFTLSDSPAVFTYFRELIQPSNCMSYSWRVGLSVFVRTNTTFSLVIHFQYNFRLCSYLEPQIALLA